MQTCLASIASSNSIKAGSEKSTTAKTASTTEFVLDSAQDMISQIYRKAVAQGINAKVTELQTKLANGENAIPVALDILKFALFSNPAQDTVRAAAMRVLGMMSPEIKKKFEDGADGLSTTPMPKPSPKEE